MTRSQSSPARGHTPALPRPSSASPCYPSSHAVTVTRRGCTAPQTASGSGPAKSDSKSLTPYTKPRWRRFETRWARNTLNPRGPRAPRCPPTKRSYAQRRRGERKRPQQRLGITHPHRARRRTACQRRARQQRHRHKAFRLTAHRANPPHPRLLQTRPHLPRATRAGSSASRLTDTDSSDRRRSRSSPGCGETSIAGRVGGMRNTAGSEQGLSVSRCAETIYTPPLEPTAG